MDRDRLMRDHAQCEVTLITAHIQLGLRVWMHPASGVEDRRRLGVMVSVGSTSEGGAECMFKHAMKRVTYL